MEISQDIPSMYDEDPRLLTYDLSLTTVFFYRVSRLSSAESNTCVKHVYRLEDAILY